MARPNRRLPVPSMFIRLALALALALTVAACGGGGGGDETTDVPTTPDAAGDTGGSGGGGDASFDSGGAVCFNDCETPGERMCDASGGVLVCGDHDDDVCLEWSAPEACAKGTCDGGYCVDSCENDCETAGARRCEDNVAQQCGDHDDDPCLEWGDVEDCGDAVCTDGFCGLTCTDDCQTLGGRRCDGDIAQQCGNHDGDPCLEWGGDTDCGAAGCDGGFCQVACDDECDAVGERRCDGAVAERCGNTDADPCLEWGAGEDCGVRGCDAGFCGPDCTNDCTVDGARRCSAGGVQECANYDEDACLEWGAAAACPEGQTCSNGHCREDCIDECTVVNARRCESTRAYAVCGNYDPDGCLEWGDPLDCAGGETCSNGFCSATCSSECTVLGATRCDGDAVQSCADANNDGCLEWGTPAPCGTSESCSNGHCTTGCTNECSVVGATQCSGQAVQTCGDPDHDGCLEWGTAVACGAGETCSNGHCATGCESECTVMGAVRCSGDAVQACGDADEDGCLEWGTAAPCGAGETCSNGFCASSCTSECTALGARRCQGDAVQICGDTDDDPCLEWGTADPCPNTQICSNGHCALDCQNECTLAGAQQCASTGAYQLCSDHDADGCLEWGTPVACVFGETCAGGACVSGCVSECTYVGARRCDDSGSAYQLCGDANADDCLEWGTAQACPPATTCSSGQCALGCVDECTVIGGRRCDLTGLAFETCDDHDTDGCLEWGSSVACAAGEVCSDGQCAVDCVDECDSVGARQCDGTGLGYQICDDYDPDDCLEWGTEVACAAEQVCADGYCAATCTDDCDVAGQTRCNVSATGVQTCGDHDADECLEWGTAAPCGETETCNDGVCTTVAAPGTVLISEALYDGAATEDDTFVELYGDPGLDLTGFLLVGVNGLNNQDYQPIELSGSIPDDGFFVVAPPRAMASILAEADLLHQNADYQNSPDSIQLRWGGAVIDAVGYGSFGPTEFFAGEGGPAPDATAGKSLGRDGSESDTDDNSVDFSVYATPTPGTWNGAPNVRPVAVLDCPAGGALGASLTFDASGSTDEDGTIASYRFDFGDGTVSTGPSDASVHAYADVNSYDVTLTVTDDRGAMDSDTCTVTIADANTPRVVVVRPMEDLVVTQGTALIFEVDATPAPGRTISQVALYADGVAVGAPDDQVPYRFEYTVADDAPTGSTLAMTARATDSQGTVGTSPVRSLFVRNDPPVASFTAIISGNLLVTVDATSASDTETPAAQLEVRWDWENDGTWDTAWSTTKIAEHLYAADGEHTIGMEVRDAVAQTDTATRTIDFQLVLDVFGPISTTLWMGTVNVTGDTWVPAGQTLRIAPGTTVVFVQVDQDPVDGVGDYDLVINGTLSVEGTADHPVTFTVLGDNQPSGWNKVQIASGSTGSTIRHAIFEYADIALDLRAPATVENCEFRFNQVGVKASGFSSPFTLNDTEIHHSEGDGLWLQNARVTSSGLDSHDNGGHGVRAQSTSSASAIEACVVTHNGGSGFFVETATVNVSTCDVTYNGETGLFFKGGAGTVNYCQIKYNDEEGVRGMPSGTTSATPTLEWNNIFGNGDQGSLVVEAVSLSAVSTAAGTGTFNSATYSTPGSEPILWADLYYDEYDYDYYNYINGALRTGGGATIASYNTDLARTWLDITNQGASSLSTRVVDNTSSSYYGSFRVYNVVYVKRTATRQVTQFSLGALMRARHNYFGAWPDVLPQLSYSDAAHLDIEGFVGVAFDETWEPGPYRGGETLAADETWDADVFLTGTVTIPTGVTLTIPAGTTVTFVPTDQDGNGVGDWRLWRGAGTLDVNGTAGDEVLFTVLGAVPAGGGFEDVYGDSSGATTMEYAIVEKGKIGLRGAAGSLTLDHVTLRANKTHGLFATGATVVNATRLTATGNGQAGVRMEGNGLRTLPYYAASNNGTWGADFVTATNVGNQITDAEITLNTDGGVRGDRSRVDVLYSNVTYNGTGVRLLGNSGGTVGHCNIKYNTSDGVFAAFTAGGQPANLLNGNNIFGNGTEEGGYAETVTLTATTTAAGTGTVDSSVFSTGGPVLEYADISYDEYDYDYYNYINGSIRKQGGATMYSYSTDYARAWLNVETEGATSISARVVDNTSSSYYGSARVYAVFFHKTTVDPARVVEMSVVRTSGSLDAKGNFWGVFGAEVADRIIQNQSNVVDFSGFKSTALTDVGPRP